MSANLAYAKKTAFGIMIGLGLAVFSQTALAHDYSQASIRDAQHELKEEGYYRGPVDGIDGPMTRAAIRKYQEDKNLAVNGRLDQITSKRLRVRMTNAPVRMTGEANRSAEIGSRPSSATVSAAQRSLQRKGFYKGNVDGSMGPETHAALREYQKNSNLTVTGKLDAATLNSLGVSK